MVEGPIEVTTGTVGKVLYHPAPLETQEKDRYDFSLVYSGVERSDGPWSEPVYSDGVRAWGINIGNVPGQKKDPNKAYAAWHLESKFYQPNVVDPSGTPTPYLEHFLTFIPANSTTNLRPIGFIGTHDGSFLQGGFAVHSFFLTLPGGAPKVELEMRANEWRVYDGIKFLFAKNNVPVALQRNAADTASYKLPYMNASDQIVIERPITSGNGVNANGPTFQSRGASTSVALYEAPDAGAATATFACGTGAARKAAIAGVDAAGNLVFAQSGTVGAMYLDFNASAIWRDRLNGYVKRMELSKARLNVEAPIRPLNCTLAQATPSGAVAAGVGAEIYITDHPAGLVKVVSDGVQWRHIATAGAPL